MYTPITQPLGTNSDKLVPVIYPSEAIPSIWEEMEGVLAICETVSNGMITTKLIHRWLLDGDAVAFGILKDEKLLSVLVVMPVQYATYKVARVIAYAGKNFIGTMQFIDALEAWALMQGCVELEGWCREEVVKLVSRYGWKPTLTIVSRDLRRKLQ